MAEGRVGRERDKKPRSRPSLCAGGWALSDKACWGLPFSECGFQLGICGCLSASLGFLGSRGITLARHIEGAMPGSSVLPAARQLGEGKKKKKKGDETSRPARFIPGTARVCGRALLCCSLRSGELPQTSIRWGPALTFQGNSLKIAFSPAFRGV